MKDFLRRLVLKEIIPIPAGLYYFLLGLLSKCKKCYDGVIFPNYGKCQGEKEDHHDNYDDIDNGCGIYYCPNKDCKYSKKNQYKKLHRLYNKR